jgi:hypothetical protein
MEDRELWEKAQELARQNCPDLYGERWGELDKYEREDCVWHEYEKLLKEKENNMNTKLVCPNCGTEMKLPEKSEFVMGMTLSKETGGTHVLQADVVKNNNLNTTKLNKEENKNMNTRENRMATLNNAGVDVSKFFNVTLPNGDVVKMTMENGVPVVVKDEVANDPILNQIIEDGYVRNTKLHRRFVMAHMFRMLNYKSYKGNESGYDVCLRNCYGYMYQFDMMLEEVRVLSKLEVRDLETFNERKHFFDKYVVLVTCGDYLDKLKEHINNQKSKNCKGVPYKRIKGRDIFVSDLNKKVYDPIQKQIWKIERTKNYTEMYRELKKFVDSMIKLPWDTKKCKAWIDAYKGNGSFYTLKNLVMYHDCKIYYEAGYGYCKTKDVYAGTEAVKFIQSKLDEYNGEGWRYMAMLKKCIADNHFDFSARMKEVYKK